MKVAPHAPMHKVAHDVNRWGPLAADSPGQPSLKRYADLVREAMNDHGLSQTEAARAVLTHPPEGGLFYLDREKAARPIGDGQQIGAVHINAVLALLSGEPVMRTFTGSSGALSYLQWCWVDHGDADTDLDAKWPSPFAPEAGRLALLAEDAQAIKVSLRAMFSPPPTSATEKRALVNAAIDQCKPPADFEMGHWSAAHRKELLRQYDLLKNLMGSAAASDELHKNWGYSKNPIASGGPLNKVLTKARKKGPKPAG